MTKFSVVLTNVFIGSLSLLLNYSEAQIYNPALQKSADGSSFYDAVKEQQQTLKESPFTNSFLHKQWNNKPLENPFTNSFLNMNNKALGNPFVDSFLNMTNNKKDGQKQPQVSSQPSNTNTKLYFTFGAPPTTENGPELSGHTKSQIRKEENVVEMSDHNEDNCELSITTVGERRVCRNVVIFSDNFKKLDEDVWTKESFIPSYSRNLDASFNYFDKMSVTNNGEYINFTPTILNDSFVRSGTLELNGCTSDIAEECKRTSHYQWILPPTATGRVTTRKSFSFKYGIIEINAKVPEGDWLIPEMWLVPKNDKYGFGLESGRIVISMVRGNKELEHEGTDLSYKTVESSLVMSSGGKVRYRTLRALSEEPWPYHYNKYTFTWRPDRFTFSINGIVIGNLLNKTFTGTLANLVGYSHDEEKKWFDGSAIAPFDQEFYISLGLSVGGRDFPDDSVSGNYVKPWKSKTVKEMLNFWLAKEKWEKTWNDSHFKIFKVKVKSL